MTDDMDETTTIPLSKKMKELLHEEGKMREKWNDLISRVINELRMWRQLHDIYRWDCGNINTLLTNINLLKLRVQIYDPHACLQEILNPNWIPSHSCPDEFEGIFRERIWAIDRANCCLVWTQNDEFEVLTVEQIKNGELRAEPEPEPVDSIEDTEEEKGD